MSQPVIKRSTSAGGCKPMNPRAGEDAAPAATPVMVPAAKKSRLDIVVTRCILLVRCAVPIEGKVVALHDAGVSLINVAAHVIEIEGLEFAIFHDHPAIDESGPPTPAAAVLREGNQGGGDGKLIVVCRLHQDDV